MNDKQFRRNNTISYFDQLIKQMFVARKLGGMIQSLDLFKVPATMLYKSQQVGSIFGGLVSLIAIALTMLLFFPNLKSFFSFSSFSFQSTNEFMSPDIPYKINGDIFNISIITVGYLHSKRAFDVIFQKRQNLFGEIQEKVGIKCDFQWWRQKYGQQVYEEVVMVNQTALCPPSDFNMTIYGRYTTPHSRIVVILKRCYAQDCISDKQFAQLNPFFVVALFPDTKFRLSQATPYKFTLNDNTFFNIYPKRPQTFGTHIILKEVQINDDHVNVLPQNLDFLSKQGNNKKLIVFDRTFDKTLYSYTDAMISITFMKNPQRTTITRKIIKIDELISNLGGFLAIFLGLAQFFAVGYNQTLLKMKVGKRICFKHDESFQDNFSVLQHVKLALLGCCIDPKAEGSYSERAKLLLMQIQENFSIDNLLDRLASCQLEISNLSGNIAWKKKMTVISAVELQMKEYGQEESRRSVQINDQFSSQLIQKQQLEENAKHRNIINRLTGKLLIERNGRLCMVDQSRLLSKQWKFTSVQAKIIIEKEGRRLSVDQQKKGALLCLGGTFDTWVMTKQPGQQVCLLALAGTELVISLIQGKIKLSESIDSFAQHWIVQ